MQKINWKQACRVMVAAAGVLFLGVSANADEFFPQPLTSTQPAPTVNGEQPTNYEALQNNAAQPAPANNGTLYAFQDDEGGLFGGELGDPWTASSLLGENPPFTIGGHTQFGYHNTSTGVFNTHPNHFDLQQGWLYLERVADGSKGLGLGGRVDILYGTDAQNTQAFGNNPGRFDFANGWDYGVYGWAMPQIYAEAAWDNWSMKVGHFFTPAGYEVVDAPGNFFYSHSLTHNFSEPFTHTGVLATYKASDELTGYAGWTAGWDTGFDTFNNGSNFIGGFSYDLSETMNLTYTMTVGNLGLIGDGNSHHFVYDWNFAENWEYVFGSDIVHTNVAVFTGNGYDSVSLNNYLFYTVNERVKLGGRAEWWKADGLSYYVITGGVNYQPMANLTIRPELRYQWSPAGDGAAGNPVGLPLKGAMFGLDAVLTF